MLVENYKFGIGKEVDSDKRYYLPISALRVCVNDNFFLYFGQHKLVEQRKTTDSGYGVRGSCPFSDPGCPSN